MQYKKKPIHERFWAKVYKTASCWLWKGASRADGYGQINIAGRMVGVHRVAWMLANGVIPKGLSILHICDVPLCVRPSHLYAGTHLDNMRDMSKKGRKRAAIGERHGSAKLTEADVLVIRQSKASQVALGKEFGVSPTQIANIVHKRDWTHV